MNMAQYYDYVLGAIPLVLVCVTGALWFSGLSMATALLAGAGLSALLIGHALFVNTPTQPKAGSTTSSHRVDTE